MDLGQSMCPEYWPYPCYTVIRLDQDWVWLHLVFAHKNLVDLRLIDYYDGSVKIRKTGTVRKIEKRIQVFVRSVYSTANTN